MKDYPKHKDILVRRVDELAYMSEPEDGVFLLDIVHSEEVNNTKAAVQQVAYLVLGRNQTLSDRKKEQTIEALRETIEELEATISLHEDTVAMSNETYDAMNTTVELQKLNISNLETNLKVVGDAHKKTKKELTAAQKTIKKARAFIGEGVWEEATK
jgi:chromosome segregation ATPase